MQCKLRKFLKNLFKKEKPKTLSDLIIDFTERVKNNKQLEIVYLESTCKTSLVYVYEDNIQVFNLSLYPEGIYSLSFNANEMCSTKPDAYQNYTSLTYNLRKDKPEYENIKTLFNICKEKYKTKKALESQQQIQETKQTIFKTSKQVKIK